MIVAGIGCVSSLGADWPSTVASLRAGVRPEPVELLSGDAVHRVFRAPEPAALARSVPRLRRSSAISLFACAAAREAWAAAGKPDPSRTAIILAASNGAVVYTRKFYDDIVVGRAGSPLLFPETVYNAPASHVAADLGIDGEVLTLVGDATAALDSLRTASELLASGTAQTCLVIAAEEIDPVTCDAYSAWRLGGNAGAILSEGAVALVLQASGSGPAISTVSHGTAYGRGLRMSDALRTTLASLADPPPDRFVSSASGTRADRVEHAVLERLAPGVPIETPAFAAGQAFAVSAMLQAALACELPGRSVISVAGWNGQVAAASVENPSL